MSPAPTVPPAIVIEAREAAKELNASHKAMAAAMLEIARLARDASVHSRALTPKEQILMRSASESFTSSSERFKAALLKNQNLLGQFLVENEQLRQTISRLEEDIAALQIDAEPTDDAFFFSHIRQAIAVIRGTR
jgi:hypothetical protein